MPESVEPERPAATVRAGDAFLVSDLLEAPYRLFRRQAVTLGRDAGCQISLPSPIVSRRHAFVRWSPRGFVIFDTASTNGTYVNGTVVNDAFLQHGDKISIGPFEFTFYTRLPETCRSERPNETAVFAMPGWLSGDAGQVSLAELWQLVEFGAKSGILEMRDGALLGRIWFADGIPLHAECGALAGDAAALALLRLSRGKFRFAVRESVRVDRTIQRTTCGLLLEAARLADEAGRAAAASPVSLATSDTARVERPSGVTRLNGGEACSR
jgi:hypothetical protein